jgi:hypothetical protein
MKALLEGKTFYVIADKSLENFKAIFNDSTITISEGNSDSDGNQSYSFDNNGNIHFPDGATITNIHQTDDYIEGVFSNIPSSFTDDTEWFESTYDKNISDFDNNVVNLKNWFLENGLWDTNITSDGKINKYGDKKFDGYWYIKNNIFYFAYPDDNYLDLKAYKIENNKLLKQTDAPYSEKIRFYYDKTKRDDYLSSLLQ